MVCRGRAQRETRWLNNDDVKTGLCLYVCRRDGPPRCCSLLMVFFTVHRSAADVSDTRTCFQKKVEQYLACSQACGRFIKSTYMYATTLDSNCSSYLYIASSGKFSPHPLNPHSLVRNIDLFFEVILTERFASGHLRLVSFDWKPPPPPPPPSFLFFCKFPFLEIKCCVQH